jgi:hypothetical protein
MKPESQVCWELLQPELACTTAAQLGNCVELQVGQQLFWYA